MAGVFNTVLEVSISAGVLILLALGARLVIGRRPGIIFPILSALIIVRLAVPVIIPSPLSVQNLFARVASIQPAAEVETFTPRMMPQEADAITPAENPAVNSAPQPDGYNSNTALTSVNTTAPGKSASAAGEAYAHPALSAVEICFIVWVLGMALMSGFIIFGNVRFLRELKKNRDYEAPGFIELLEDCKRELGLKSNIKAVHMSGINTAAVYGVFRPTLLVSPSFGWLSKKEKRHVLLHELSHIKRGDTLLSLLITALNIIHWFNPLVWAALLLARKDIEVMCDMAVLKKTQDRRGYAGTLLSLARTSSPKKPKLAEALFAWGPQNGHFGVLVSTYSIKRRITMIARYKKNPLLTAFALVLAAAIAITGCTGAVTGTVAADKSPDADKTNITVPEIPGHELIASYSLDISSVAGDEARNSNIKKVADMLDGTVFAHMDSSLAAAEDSNRQVNIPDVFGPITKEAGWKEAAWIGWQSATAHLFENDKGSGSYREKYGKNASADSIVVTGGGIEIAAMAIYRAAQRADLDSGIGYWEYSEEEWEKCAYPAVKVLTNGEAVFPNIADSGGIGAVNNNYKNDLILKVWVEEDESITAAFYAIGTAELLPREAHLLNNWQGTYTLKDNSLSVSIPNGWKVKDITDSSGTLYNPDSDIQFQISSSKILSSTQTPETNMESRFIALGATEDQPVILNLEILSIESVLASDMKGKIIELSAPLENGEEVRVLEAVYTGAYKNYSCSMYSNKKSDFEKYEPLFHSLLGTLDFQPNDWREKYAGKFTDEGVEKTENSYKSENINVSVGKVQENGVTYFVADIYVAEPKYFKTAFPGSPEKMGEREQTDIIAREKNAVIAINGDNFALNPGPVVRNGINYRSEKAGDVLVMNYDGSMRTYSADQLDLSKLEAEGAYQAWTYGPMLLKDGKLMSEFNSDVKGRQPLTSIGYYEPGHYCFVVVDGRQKGYSEGLTLEQLSKVFFDLGCTQAYNLQGGNSSVMTFMGEVVNQPPSNTRKVSDIVFIGE